MSHLVNQISRRVLRRPSLFHSISRDTHDCKDTSGEATSSLARLPHRLLVSVQGRDGETLLQGLVTADVTLLNQKQSMYSMLLNAQGRVLYDVILHHRGEEDLLVECDSKVADSVLKQLQRYALRSKVSIESDKSCDVWVAFPGTPQASLKNVVLAHPDPRIGMLGSRILAPASTSGTEIAPSLQTSSPEDYRRHRLELGVAEGPEEVPIGSCFPLEYNVDYLNGVSFDKGCYLGQELTARTHHSGVVRKRVVPVTFQHRAGVEVPRGTNITNDSGKNIGKLITHLEGIGLALLRVKEMNGPLSMPLCDNDGKEGVVSVAAHKPSWWPAKD